MKKRLISILLMIALLATIVPMTVLSAGAVDYWYLYDESKGGSGTVYRLDDETIVKTYSTEHSLKVASHIAVDRYNNCFRFVDG